MSTSIDQPDITFKAVKGSRLTDQQAESYGQRILELLEVHDERVEPDDLLTDAEDETSPLHDFFEWDDRKAATSYRRRQAYYLLRSINCVVKTTAGQEKAIRAFVNVTVRADTAARDNGKEVTRSVYVTVQRAMSQKTLREQVIGKALRELETWRRRYEDYREFAQVFESIDQLELVNAS